MKYNVVVPNRYPDVIQPLLKSLREFEGTANVVIICNGHAEDYGYHAIRYPEGEPFVFAKACNYGLRYSLEQGRDTILLNDDCVLLGPTLDSLAILAHHFPDVGILSPLIKGCVGNPAQRWYEKKGHWDQNSPELVKYITGVQPVCFPCVYLKRSMVQQIGLLDEKFTGYGGEDNEYSIRARSAGWKTAVTRLVTVQHGTGGRELETGRGRTWNTSYHRFRQEARQGADPHRGHPGIPPG